MCIRDRLYTVVDQFVSKLTCQRVAKVDEKEEEDVNIDADLSLIHI